MDHPLKTVHVVGAQKTNYPWGFENRLFPVFNELGWKTISTDFRQELNQLPARLELPCDFVLFCKAERVPANLIRAVKYPTMLWWAELLGSLEKTDQLANRIRQLLVHNVAAYDHVFLHDEMSIPLVKSWGAKNVSCLPTAVVNPDVQKKLAIEKKYDVTFIGQITPRREALLRDIKKHLPVHVAKCWDPEELNLTFNQSKIVLNIHSSVLLNTETRVGEVLGAGYQYVHKYHTLTERINQIIKTPVAKRNFQFWPGHTLGIIRDENGHESNNLYDFYTAIKLAHG